MKTNSIQGQNRLEIIIKTYDFYDSGAMIINMSFPPFCDLFAKLIR